MDIWDILFVLLMIFLGFLSVRNVVRFLRKYSRGKKVGIIKVVAGWGVVIIELMGIVLIVIAATRFSTAHGYRARAAEYQQTLDKVDSLLNGTGKDVTLLSTMSESYAEVERSIKELTSAARITGLTGWYALMFGIYELTMGIASIVLITEEGIVWVNVALPEPFTVAYRNGNIEVDIKAELANKKGVRVFKGTPDNMARFGRFIDWDNPETQTEAQTPPPDNNMQT